MKSCNKNCKNSSQSPISQRKFDAKCRINRNINLRDFFYVGMSPNWAMTAIDKMNLARKSKLLLKTTGPGPVLRDTTNTVTIEEEGILNNISYYRVTHSRSRTPHGTRMNTVRIRRWRRSRSRIKVTVSHHRRSKDKGKNHRKTKWRKRLK